MTSVLLTVAAATLFAADTINGPIMVKEVTPAEVHIGGVVAAHGENLDAARVLEVYLTDVSGDYKVEIVEQTKNEIHFKIPAGVPLGKMRIAVVSDEHSLLDQPVFVRVVKAPGVPSGA